MYQIIDDTVTITVNDWLEAGLTINQFQHDSKRGYLKIFRRGINGNTLIDVKSIRRVDRLRKIEDRFGRIEEKSRRGIFAVETDTKAREFFTQYLKPDGSHLDDEQIERYTNRASILEAIKRGLTIQLNARAKANARLKMGEFWELAANYYMEQTETYPCDPIKNARVLERVFKEYCNGGYASIIHKNIGNDSARVVSVSLENLLLSIYRNNNHPFVNEVHRLYLEFISGDKELFDKETGEIFRPQDFRYKNRGMEISVATVRNYLKNVLNNTAIYMDRNGNFDYVNKMRPKHTRKLGQYSLSKISMDDVALSRKSVRGWIYKYIAVDVVSGYYFRPAYVLGKPTIDTVIESFRNMFCELIELGLPMPGELEVEHHLMKDITWLSEAFPFMRWCNSPTEKRAEHSIKSLKYGASHRNGHTRGRWYAKNEAYRSIRNKVDGDYVEPMFQPQAIIADDLADIEQHNNELHPLQKTYPGMTRKDVLIKQYNPNLRPIEKWYLYKFIGNMTETTLYNNDYCPVQMENFEIVDFECLKRLKPNNNNVTAYWLPDADGSIKEVYLYQGDTYIGEAINKTQYKYNENAIERTEADYENMLHQEKRAAKFDKFIKERRKSIPKVGVLEGPSLQDIEVKIIEETEQPKGYEEDEFTEIENIDWAARALQSL